MTSRRQWLRLVLGASVGLLSGCSGWYLRGTRKTSMTGKQVFVTSSPGGRLDEVLRPELTYAGVRITQNRSKADAVVILQRETFDRRVLSVDPGTGKVREVELGLEVRFEVRAGNGRILIAPEKFTFYQDFVFDEGSVLGTEEVEQAARTELDKEAARSLVLRIENLQLDDADERDRKS